MIALLIIAALLLLTVAAALQAALPRIAERRVRDRLVEHGGEAAVRIRSVPATRLLRNSGERIEVRGSGLEITLSPPVATDASAARTTRSGLSALDGFDEVDIELVGFRTGPFDVDAFVLERRGGGSYAMAVRAQTTPAELASLGQGTIPGGSLIGSVAGATPLGSRSFGVSLQIELISERSGLRVGAGGGSIAGYPAGPFAATIAAAVARRLEIVP